MNHYKYSIQGLFRQSESLIISIFSCKLQRFLDRFSKMQLLIFSIPMIILIMMSVKPGNCRNLPKSEETANSSPCNNKMEDVCSSFEDSEDYSMQLKTDNFHTTGKIQVKVYSTQCPIYGVESPWWYKLEAIESSNDSSSHNVSNDNETVAIAGGDGKFERLSYRKCEAALCNSNSSVVFTTCSPKPWDLPAHYTWKKTTSHRRDLLCFRLTVQLSGESICKQSITCHSTGGMPTPDSQTTHTTEPDYYYNDETEVKVGDHETEVKVSDSVLLGSAGITETFEDVEDENDLVMEMFRKYNITKQTQMTGDPTRKGCLKVQKLLMDNDNQWIPDCKCNGEYKRVQCIDKDEYLECWCSTRTGSEIVNSRRIMQCTDPQQFDFEC